MQYNIIIICEWGSSLLYNIKIDRFFYHLYFSIPKDSVLAANERLISYK